ncbi:DUF5397 family protein [Neisseria iguanae]|uniref:DUF5397 family protein n=1 Tax=Neisseria iguanae TaxID=90242 RepID=UPI00147512D3
MRQIQPYLPALSDVPYIVGEPLEQLPDGDWLVNIEVLESGEQTQYKLSHIIQDPKAI